VQLGEHLALPLDVLAAGVVIEFQMLHHHGGEAVQLQRMENRILRADDIPGPPQTQRDRFTVVIPGC
jgi:hypothetical protein